MSEDKLKPYKPQYCDHCKEHGPFVCSSCWLPLKAETQMIPKAWWDRLKRILKRYDESYPGLPYFSNQSPWGLALEEIDRIERGE
jgi:hypothetical protein